MLPVWPNDGDIGSINYEWDNARNTIVFLRPFTTSSLISVFQVFCLSRVLSRVYRVFVWEAA